MASEDKAPTGHIQIRVELPAYGYSFSVSLPPSTIMSLKHAISHTCPGSPEVSGQRVIWRGRCLGDEEDLGQISGGDGVAVVHLSVHPSAWKGSPPSLPKNEDWGRKDKGKEREVVPTPTTSLPPTTTPSPPEFILWKHRDALSRLTLSATPTSPSASARTEAVKFVNRHGFVWPSILDESYPLSQGETGVKYEKVIISNKPYLRLLDSSTPTPTQLHAFKVLSYTLELIKLPHLPEPTTNPTSATTPAPLQVPAQLNTLLQQMGLPPIRDLGAAPVPIVFDPNAPIANPNNPFGNPPAPGPDPVQQNNPNPVLGAGGVPIAQLHHANPRPRPNVPILPLLLLLLRTSLLLYFIGPARKPFMVLVIVGWVIWEIAGWLGVNLGALIGGGGVVPVPQGPGQQVPGQGLNQNQNQQGAGQGVANDARQVQPDEPAAAAPANPNPNVQPANQPLPNANANPAANNDLNNLRAGIGAANLSLIDTLASFDIAHGDAALASTTEIPNTLVPEPPFPRKSLSFLMLFVASVHPAVWNKRRRVLGEREGRVRVEMRAVAAAAGAEAAAAAAGNTGTGDGDVSPPSASSSNEEDNDARGTALTTTTDPSTLIHAQLRDRYLKRPDWVKRYMRRVVGVAFENIEGVAGGVEVDEDGFERWPAE